MDTPEIKEKILKIMDDFGMSGGKAAEAMGVAYPVFRNKKSESNPGHTFNEKNYRDLVNFLKAKVESLDNNP